MFRRSLSRRLAAVAALSTAALLASPTIASADAVTADPLNQAILALEQTGSASSAPALAAAKAISASSVPVAGDAAVNPLAILDTANAALKALGFDPFFYPTAAVNCSAIPAAPLGIVPAVAGAAPGPWPNLSLLGTPLTAVPSGQTMYAFIPAGIGDDSKDKTGMQVAWFNANTLKGGMAAFGGAADTLSTAVLSQLPPVVAQIVGPALTQFLNVLPSAGTRLAPVDTGKGTVLAAVFGTVNHTVDGAPKSCFFFPTVGLTQVG